MGFNLLGSLPVYGAACPDGLAKSLQSEPEPELLADNLTRMARPRPLLRCSNEFSTHSQTSAVNFCPRNRERKIRSGSDHADILATAKI
jgi:hypothetical protein